MKKQNKTKQNKTKQNKTKKKQTNKEVSVFLNCCFSHGIYFLHIVSGKSKKRKLLAKFT